MKKLKAAVIGMGFIGVSHVEAIRRIGLAEIVGVADTDAVLAQRKSEEYGIDRCYKSADELLADPEIDVVHNCTPNNLHLELNRKIIRAGKHVFSEKPLGKTAAESKQMLELLKEYPDTVHGVNFCYRMNPLVQDMKSRIAAGEIGAPRLVHGSYLQDWLLFDTDYNWRIEPEISGESRCVADIGSHWMDVVQTVTGAKITEVCADVVTAIPVRKKPKGQVETFAVQQAAEYEEKKVETEDYAAVLIRFENGAHGVFQASEISAGRKCFLNFEVNGEKASYYWCQERADEMWKGNRDANNELVMRNPNLMSPKGREYTYLAAGHPEGWNDAMKNNVASFYRYIADGKKPGKDPADFATFEDGDYIMRLTEAILKSGREKRWVSVAEME